MTRTLATFAAVFTTLFAAHVHAQTVVDDWTLNEGTGFDSSDHALNSVNSYEDMADTYDPQTPGTFGTSSIGGPSDNPVYLSNDLGFYAPAGNREDFPTTDFTLSLYTQTSDLGQTGVLFCSNSNNDGGFQIVLENGDFVAILMNGSGNLDGTTIGSFAATTADTELSVTDIAGVYTFTDNGVNSAPVAATDLVDAPFNGVMIGLPPGASPYYTGYMSDVTITDGVTSLSSVPEPSTYLMMGLGFLGLAAVRRFRRLQVD